MATPRMLLVAHGSQDPSYCDVIVDIARRALALRPGLTAAIGYLDHCEPAVSEVYETGDLVVPLLLSRGFHASADIAAAAPGATVAAPLGPSPLLAAACADRLREAGWDGQDVVLAAAGTSDPNGLLDIQAAAALLADELSVRVVPSYLSSASPRLEELLPAAAVCTYLLAPGRFASVAAGCGAPIVSAVIGDHPAVAELILHRYDAANGRPASRT